MFFFPFLGEFSRESGGLETTEGVLFLSLSDFANGESEEGLFMEGSNTSRGSAVAASFFGGYKFKCFHFFRGI